VIFSVQVRSCSSSFGLFHVGVGHPARCQSFRDVSERTGRPTRVDGEHGSGFQQSKRPDDALTYVLAQWRRGDVAALPGADALMTPIQHGPAA
jgi:hypothetical protein